MIQSSRPGYYPIARTTGLLRLASYLSWTTSLCVTEPIFVRVHAVSLVCTSCAEESESPMAARGPATNCVTVVCPRSGFNGTNTATQLTANPIAITLAELNVSC
jgi:hypothetical protein